LALAPLGELARSGDGAAAARLAGFIGSDPDWPVRARAAELGSGIAPAQAALVGAARDPEPRVREAALQALATSPPPAAFLVAREVLHDDGWSFVKAQAVGVLAHAPDSPTVDEALRVAMNDPAVRVRALALHAVALRHTRALHGAVRERLDDAREDVEVRAAAAAAAGALCDDSSADRLTELARRLAAPSSEEDQQVAFGALLGLAALHPVDLHERLAPLLARNAPPSVRTAAQNALSARGMCR
ncbi:MAG: HEAT repeat domain-containing protein, partial [Polyangiaceae bacterium]